MGQAEKAHQVKEQHWRSQGTALLTMGKNVSFLSVKISSVNWKLFFLKELEQIEDTVILTRFRSVLLHLW